MTVQKRTTTRSRWYRRTMGSSLAVAMLGGLAGCGGSSPTATATSSPTSSASTSSTPTSQATQSNFNNAVASYESAKISAEQRPQNAELAVEAGGLAGDSGQYGEALRWFQRAEALNPELLPALTGQGQMWMELGRPGLAAKAYEKALDHAPQEPLLLLEMARAYTYVRDFGEALRFAKLAEKYAPENADVYRALSLISAQVLDVEGSLKAARRVCDLKPEDPESWNNLSGLLLRNQRYPESEAALRKALTLDRGNVNANLFYAQALVEGRKTPAADAEAFAVLSRARSTQPNNSDALLMQGQIQVRLGNLPLAISLLRQAREEAPRSQEILLALGQALNRNGQAEQGIRLVNESQRLGPVGIPFMDLEAEARRNPNPAVAERLAEMYRRKEMYDSAIRVLERTLKTHGQNASLQAKLAAVRAQADRERPVTPS